MEGRRHRRNNRGAMSFASRVRQALPLRIQPFARYHYESWRGLLERELPLFCDFIHSGDRVIDVGANFGIYVHALRRRGARIEAFEPQAYCANVLRAYAASDPAISVHEVALGASQSIAELEVPIVGGKIARGSASIANRAHEPMRSGNDPKRATAEWVSVEVRSLDSYAFKDVRAMKIDVEGAELDVLGGAVETLGRCRPIMMIEVEQRHHDDPIDRVFATIAALGYAGSFLLPGRGLVPLAEFRVEVHQQETALGDHHGLYVNNFFFRPAS
jgi:FkbM family methyltransferase